MGGNKSIEETMAQIRAEIGIQESGNKEGDSFLKLSKASLSEPPAKANQNASKQQNKRQTKSSKKFSAAIEE